jgi:hypothetical protein
MCEALPGAHNLPFISFGTDSPLDQDIKERLMSQVLSVLSVKPDDEQAYNAYHKYEANKRLHAKREADKQAEVAAQQAMQSQKMRQQPRRPQPQQLQAPVGATNFHGSSNGSNSLAKVPLTEQSVGGALDRQTRIQLLQNELLEVKSEDEHDDDDIDAEVAPERLAVRLVSIITLVLA